MIRPARLLCAAMAGAAWVLLMGAPMPATAETEGVYSIGIPSADDPPPVEAVRTAAASSPAAPAGAEVQAVWDLGAAGNWASATRLLAALEASHASWKAPARLKTYLSNGQRDQRITAALAAKDWSGALALIPATGADSCASPFLLWSRAEATEGLGVAADIRAFYVRALNTCDDPATIAELAGRSLQVLDADGLAALRSAPSLNQSADPHIMIAYARLVSAETRLRFDAAAGRGDLAAVARLAGKSDDPSLLTQAGWLFLKQDSAVAATYFERALAAGGDDDTRRGLVLATLANASASRDQGDWQRAVTLATRAGAADKSLAADADDLIGGALLDGAGESYDKGNFAEAGDLARQAAQFTSSRRAGLMRAAWSDLQRGRPAEAADAFSRLYTEKADAEAAEGYALAAEKSGDLGAAAALARVQGGPLVQMVSARYAAAAFNDGDYLTARAYAPGAYDALGGIDRPWLRQAVSVRSQGGTAGENRLRAAVSTTSAGLTRGPSRLEAGLSVYTLDPGSSASGGARETFSAPYAAWSREGGVHLAARIGLLPLGSDADPALTGEFAASRGFSGHTLEARAFSRPKTDSALSFAGQTYGGTTYGRVSETGALVRARVPVGEAYAVQADLSAAHLGGENTADNSMISAGVSASRAIEQDGFAYLVTGPFYQFQSYDQNTNFFAPGHGGYFSPQSFHRAGWSANAQTDPLKDWIVKADAAVAFESAETDPAPVNPLLAGPQPFIGGGKSTGVATAFELAAARKVSSEVILSANLSAIASEAYEDFRVGVALTWTPGGRASVGRADLPSDPFNPGSWTRP